MTLRTAVLALAATFLAVCATANAQILDGGGLLHLRFSPDGRYVLAQSASSVTVLTVQPFRVLFSIPAGNATAAEFTPDSHDVVFVASGTRVSANQVSYSSRPPRVERWSVSEGERIDSVQMPMNNCGTMELSPDGRSFACLDFEGTLTIVDVASREPVLRKKQFGKDEIASPSFSGYRHRVRGADRSAAEMAFSADGHYLLVIPRSGGGVPFAWDLQKRTRVRLRGELRNLRLWMHVAFVKPDLVVVSAGVSHGQSAVSGYVAPFPSGEPTSAVVLPPGPLSRASNADFVLSSLGKTRRSAATDYSTGQALIGPTPAIDVLGDWYAVESQPGEVGLYQRGKGLRAVVKLDGNN